MAKRGRPTVRVTVSPSERTTLEQWARRRTTAQGLAQRAQIVLACAAGRSNSDIATELRITRQTVGRWRRRFVAKRLDGAVDMSEWDRQPPLLPLSVEQDLTSGDREPARLLLTPWFEASRHVVCLYFDGATKAMCGVAKVPRRP